MLWPLVGDVNGIGLQVERSPGVVATNSICSCTLVLLEFTAVITAGPALFAVTVTLALPVPSVLAVAALNVPRVVEKLIGEFATPVPFCCHWTVTTTLLPSETSVPAAGVRELERVGGHGHGLSSPICRVRVAVSVSLPPFVALIVNAARPCASVVSCVADRPFDLAEVIATALFAMPVPPAFVSTTE